MLQYIDIQSLKKKFATAISKLYTNCGISVENIEDKMISSELFDFLENNNTEEFMEMSYESLGKVLFNASSVFNEERNEALYWAGLQYMNISLNCNIPLRQVALICPLSRMLTHFEIYHEMNDIRMVEEFMKNEYRRSILKALRNREGLSVRQLGELTGISENTIKHYEKSNENLFKASFENIVSLTRVLKCSYIFFVRESEFVPLSRTLWEHKEFREEFDSNISRVFGKAGIQVLHDSIPISIERGRKKQYLPDVFVERSFRRAFDSIRKSSSELLI